MAKARTRRQPPDLARIRRDERRRIVKFLRRVFDESTHGASHLMDRAIEAVRINDLADPIRVAEPIDSGISLQTLE